ncbi:ATP-binding protein [Algoriphagus namhaensis]|uniref:histidine kinase n=1 Tax=Algoriphagus namhaensis TaxID=915353 RepID=A0ABV8ASM7_9BACT
MKKLFCISFLFLLLPLISIGQQSENENLNSLHLTLKKASNDTLRMDSYREIGFYYQNGNPDSALYYHRLQLELSKKLKMRLWEADAYQQIGYVQVLRVNFPESLLSFFEAFKIAEDEESEKNAWNVSRFSLSKNPQEARLSILGMIHNDIHRLYKATGKPDQERENLLSVLRIGELTQNRKLLTLSNRGLGEFYLDQGIADSVLYYLNQARNYYQTSKYQLQRGKLYEIIGNYYFQEQEYDSALKNYNVATLINIEQSQLQSLASTYIQMSKVYFINDKLDSSEYFAQKGIQTAREGNFYTTIADGNFQLYKLNEKKGELSQAIAYLSTAKIITDSLNESFTDKLIQFQNIILDEQLALKEKERKEIEERNRLRTYSFLGGAGIFIAIGLLMYRNNRQKTKANKKLEETLHELQTTQVQLIQSEKMASLGELTAGIAHEIQNPLNFVNNFSELNSELVKEAVEELEKGDIEETKFILKDLGDNSDKITIHGKRADAIVKGMLEHSKRGSGQKVLTNLNALADEFLRLSYQSFLAKEPDFKCELKTDLATDLPQVSVIPQDIGKVLLNLINNAFYAVHEKSKSCPEGYKPEIIVSSKKTEKEIELSVQDNGPGIPDSIKEKIFQPFFTTKPTGSGTGLGLSLSYDIVKAHGGELRVWSEEGKGTIFRLHIPIS